MVAAQHDNDMTQKGIIDLDFWMRGEPVESKCGYKQCLSAYCRVEVMVVSNIMGSQLG